MTSRRDAVKTLSALVAAGLLPRDSHAGAAASSASIERLGVQLYTVRSLLTKDVPGTLAAVATLGYREVEFFGGVYGSSPAETRKVLNDHGLTAPSVHLGLEDVRERFDATAAIAATMGFKYLTVASLDMRTMKTVDDWKRTADVFNDVGRRAKGAGLRFGYHNHSVEFTPVDGRIPMDILIAGTDPSLVTFELDMYWAMKAGHEPRTLFARFPGRFEMVHVKDATAAPELKMTEVGSGAMDWKGIFAQRGKAGIKHYFVEHDNPQDPMDSIRKSANFLTNLRF